MQHGTLRNVLGALGDAFLVGGGKQPAYADSLARIREGAAMAGYDPNDPASVQAAISRVAMTGSPGSIQDADALQKNANDIALRKAMLEQQNWYRQSRIDDQREATLTRWQPQAAADLAQATNAADYAARKARWNARIKALYPDQPNTTMDTSSAFGIPDEYIPGAVNSTTGMTSNQVQESIDKGLGRQTSVQVARIRAGGTEAAAGINANKPDQATFDDTYIKAKKLGLETTPEEDARFAHDTQVSGKAKLSLLTGGTHTGGGGGNIPTVTPQQAARLPKGTQFRTTDGRVLIKQ
jgi:hypothetical protein